VFAAMGASGCQGQSAAAPAPTPRLTTQLIKRPGRPPLLAIEPSQVPGMSFTEVRKVALPDVLEANGVVTFDTRRVAKIVARVSGRIEASPIAVWDQVRKGEKIVQLYSPDFMTAEAEYLQSLSTASLSKAPQMAGTGGLAKAMVQAARTKLELLGMDYRDIMKLQTPQPRVWIRSPISGTVIKNQAVIGSQVNPGDVLFVVGTLNKVWVTAQVYEDDLARVHEGQELQAVTTAFPNQVFRGTITRISPDIDPHTHTAAVRCDVENQGLRLKPGMLARVRILTKPGYALVVPQGALVFDTDSYYAFVRSGEDAVERRKVDIGPWSEQGYTRVISGLKPGERVVIGQTLQVNALWHRAVEAGS
jgi:Cu(I)/Ag(I) efflux system membrane fusion protein